MVDDAGSFLLNSMNKERLRLVFGGIHGLGGSEAPGNCSELAVIVTSTEEEVLFLLMTWYPPPLRCQETQRRYSSHCCESPSSFAFPRP